MATHWGNEGIVRVGANAVAEVINFSFNQSVSPVDSTAMGDGWETHIAGSGIKKWDGSLECHWDETDVNGQELLVVGASVSLTLAPEGVVGADVRWSGTATITDVGIDVPMSNGTIKRSFKFQGSGALTQA